MQESHDGPRTRRWAVTVLIAILLLDLWLRGHAFSPTVTHVLGLRVWPVVEGEAEPLDSDEAAYVVIGQRIVRGEVLYRDLTEHKPPGGYWLFALAVALGGPDELTVRRLPIPFVLATIGMVWWLGLRISGSVAACAAAVLYALLSTDPHLSGDAATLEHPLNALSVASLALMVGAATGAHRSALAAAGAAVAGACLVRQVAITHLVVYGSWLMVRAVDAPGRRARDMLALLGGFGVAAGAAVAVLAVQGALPEAYHDCVRYAAFQAAEAPRPAEAPPFLVRWIVGEIDESDGRLPWPFGDSPRVRWWGAGLWPIWLALPPALAALALVRPSGPRRLVVAWTLSAAVQVALPGLFWQHYYLLLAPGAALAYGALIGDAGRRAGEALAQSDPPRFYAWATAVTALVLVLAVSGVSLARSYLLTPADRLQPVFKGGSAWPQLRTIGREIGHRAAATWPDARLFVWGWQSPIYIYSGLDGVSREVFADPLLEAKARADPGHPLIRPRLERIIADLRRRRPEVVFVGIAPFAGLRSLLEAHYEPWRRMPGARGGEGIWVLRGDLDRFASARPGETSRSR